MGFIKSYFKEREDEKKLADLIHELSKKMDDWIAGFENDGTPPNDEQCVELEDAKIAELVQEYEERAPGVVLTEGGAEHISEYCEKLKGNLERMKGDLIRRFSDVVDTLEDKAANAMRNCVATFENKVAEITKTIPLRESTITYEFETMLEDLTGWVESRYPEGAAGLDNYDDTLPDDLPSWTQFKENVAAKVEELQAANTEAIPAAIEDIKERALESVKQEINDAIRKTVEDVKKDLSDDVFKFLDGDAAAELRNDLISATEEYAQLRLSSE